MRIDWSSIDSFKRLLAAMVAAQDMKLNYNKIAAMYGQGATYDAIEGHFRKIRKEAVTLREEHDERAADPASSTLAPKTPRKRKSKAPSSAVIGGRVKKNPGSGRRGKAIKEEEDDEDGGVAVDTGLETENVESQSGLSTSLFAHDDDMWLGDFSQGNADFGI